MLKMLMLVRNLQNLSLFLNVYCNDKPTFKILMFFGVLSMQLSLSSTFACEQRSIEIIHLEAVMHSIRVKTGCKQSMS